MDKVYVKCNNCDSDEYTVVFPEGKAQIHRIVECNNCGLMYANPQTNSAMGGKLSLNSTETEEEIDTEKAKKLLEDYTPENQQYLKKQYTHQKDFVQILTFLHNRAKGTLLEIGSHSGVFLNSAKEQGWDVLGIEPDRVPRIYSGIKFGLKVLGSSFEHADLKKNQFDVIISTHVIEHIYNPKFFIQRSNDLLKEKGVLILETPTYDSFSFRLLRHRERSVRCSGHIYFFTKKSLKALIESCGFRVLKHIKVGRTLTIDRLVTNIGIITGRRKFFEKIGKKLKLDRFVVHVNARDMQRIYCEKI